MPKAAGFKPISPNTQVRYIKLGDGGKWEEECIKESTVRLGFSTGEGNRFKLCTAKRWGDLTASFIAEGRNKGTATRFTNEVKSFFEDDGSILWITFFGECLHWCILSNEPAQQFGDNNSVRRFALNGWQKHDLKGELLTTERLSGALTKLAAYRGTSCSVDVAAYAIQRINGNKSPQVERAITAANAMKSSILEMMRLLHERDFEILVELVFSTSGWRKQGRSGGVQKTLDLDLILPTTNERAFVQVKSKSNPAELKSYVSQLDNLPHEKMFYVYHTGELTKEDSRVELIDGKKLSEMVLDAGLASWLIQKVS
jgi:hypothetical protein